MTEETFQLSKFFSYFCYHFEFGALFVRQNKTENLKTNSKVSQKLLREIFKPSFSLISVAFCPDMNFCHIHSWVDKHASREEAFAGSTATAPQCLYPDPPPGDPPSSFPA